MEIFKVFSFEAAHRLPNVPAGHKCSQLHGHLFQVEIRIRGPVNEELGWVQDFADIHGAFQPVLSQLDHTCLNEFAGLENPTSENLARWIWKRLSPSLPLLYEITVYENITSGCVYRGEGLR
jgi:6-pyruvoyltetrahydropterin/6-carboxytetrahydropterin synthase